MLKVNDSIINAYNKYTTQRKSYIQVGENSFFVQNLDVQADSYDEGNVIGNAIAKIAKFDIETEHISQLNEFELFDGIWTGNQYEYVSLGTFKLFEEQGTDDFFSSVTAYDKLINFNVEYNPSTISFPINLYNFLVEISRQAGVELSNASIPNGNQILQSNLFVEGETLKQILKAICQINGCIGIISQDKLKLLLKGTETLNLSKYQISNPEYKRNTWKINQVVLGMTDVDGEYVLRQDDEDIQKNGLHKLVINDNPFVYTQALREQYIDNLFNQVKGFGYTAFETKWEGLPYVELGDLVNIDGRESIILRYNLKSPNGLESTLSAPSIIDSVIDYVDNADSIENRQKRTEILVDKANQQIQLLSKKVVDISTTSTGIGTVNFTNASCGALGKLSITGNVELFYPALDQMGSIATKSGRTVSGRAKASSYKQYTESKYPSENLFPKDTYLVVKQTDKPDVKYHLPIKGLQTYKNISDEFVWEYNKMSLIHRVGVMPNGQTYVLAQEYIEDLGELEIVLPEGDGQIVFESFPYATLNITYMFKNEYTETFSTKAETQAQIKVASNEINLEVRKKVDKDDVISTINMSPEEIQIKGNKISLEGLVTANENFKILEDGSMETTNGKFSGTINGGKVIVNGSFTENNPYVRVDDYNSTDENPIFSNIWSDGISCINYSIGGNPVIRTENMDGFAELSGSVVNAFGFNNVSLEKVKKNIKKTEKGLDLIKKADVYSYNYRGEKNGDKKHIGLVIGEKYNTPEEIMNHQKTGIDLYSMIAVAWQSIKELNNKVEELETKIKEMEEKQYEKNTI